MHEIYTCGLQRKCPEDLWPLGHREGEGRGLVRRLLGSFASWSPTFPTPSKPQVNLGLRENVLTESSFNPALEAKATCSQGNLPGSLQGASVVLPGDSRQSSRRPWAQGWPLKSQCGVPGEPPGGQRGLGERLKGCGTHHAEAHASVRIKLGRGSQWGPQRRPQNITSSRPAQGWLLYDVSYTQRAQNQSPVRTIPPRAQCSRL